MHDGRRQLTIGPIDHPQFDSPIIQQQTIAWLGRAHQLFVRRVDAQRRTELTGCVACRQQQGVALFQRQWAGREWPSANLGTAQVLQNRDLTLAP